MKELNRKPLTFEIWMKDVRSKYDINLFKEYYNIIKSSDIKEKDLDIIEVIIDKKKNFSNDENKEKCWNEHAIYICEYPFSEIAYCLCELYKNNNQEIDIAMKKLNKFKEHLKNEIAKWYKKKYNSKKIITEKFNDTLIITDPDYIFQEKDYKKLKEIDILIADNTYGDWLCSIYNNGNKIGNFTSNSGNVCVCSIRDILKINRNFKFDEKNMTIIKDFKGHASIIYEPVEYQYNNKFYTDLTCHIEGEGNINFISKQIN